MTFHSQLMNRLDTARKNGGSLTQAHRLIREAVRQYNMKGRQFQDVEELLTVIRQRATVDPALIRNAA